MEGRHTGLTPSLLELKKLIKEESLNNPRLASLKLPRDLTLGGTKPKKIYTPNLNVVRNKDKNKYVPAKITNHKKPTVNNHGGFRSQNRNSAYSNRTVTLVQTEGIFSQGIVKSKFSIPSERSGTSRDSSSITSRSSRKATRRKSIDVRSSYQYDSESDDDDHDFDPLLLPLKDNKTVFTNFTNIKEEIKKEIDTEHQKSNISEKVYSSSSTIINQAANIKTEIKEENDVKPNQHDLISFMQNDNVFDDDNPGISLIRLPSSFMGKIWKDGIKDKNADYTLNYMPDGPLGYLRIRKSGKIELQVKNVTYILTEHENESCCETVMMFPGENSIALDPSLVTLGQVMEKFSFSPEWKPLFNQAKKKNKYIW